jgi:hypothetical protein
MTSRTRIAITIASALALGVSHYGSAWSVGTPGLERDIWDWSVLAAYAFALATVALVDRWWALLPAAVPTAVTFYLYNLTDYSTPWETIGSPSEPVAYAFLLLIGVAVQAAMLSIGFLPRRVWQWGRRARRSQALREASR